jgi:hypothetical protein
MLQGRIPLSEALDHLRDSIADILSSFRADLVIPHILAPRVLVGCIPGYHSLGHIVFVAEDGDIDPLLGVFLDL